MRANACNGWAANRRQAAAMFVEPAHPSLDIRKVIAEHRLLMADIRLNNPLLKDKARQKAPARPSLKVAEAYGSRLYDHQIVCRIKILARCLSSGHGLSHGCAVPP